MAKAPADQFYFGDLQRDMHGVRLEAVGGWMLLLCKMHFAKNRGEVTMRLEDYARFWGVSETEASSILDHLVEMDVGDRFCSVDGLITMQNRRMMRDAESRANDAERQRRSRDRRRADLVPPDADGEENVTDVSQQCHSPSSSSSSTSSSFLIDSYTRACADAFPDVDPRLVEIAVLETLIRRNGSQNEGKPIRFPVKYFAAEIRQMAQNAKKLGSGTIDAMLHSRRSKTGITQEVK